MRRGGRRAQAGFTLIEVMIALGILAMGLSVLLRSASGNLAATRRAHKSSIAAELARAKMYDLEEQLLQDGFQQLDQELDGDFDEEGWEEFTWEAKIVKIELPNLDSLTRMGAAGVEGEAAEGGEASPLLGMLAFLPGGGGDLSAGDAAAAAGAGVLTSQYEMLRNLLEESIRKITLTVKYKVGIEEDELVIDLYLTDPSAIGRQMGGLGGQGGPAAGGSQAEDDPEAGGGRSGRRSGGTNRGGLR